MKLNRHYKLTVQISEDSADLLVISSPLSAEFNVVRTSMASANRMNITVFNLSEDTRRKIFKDRYDTEEYRGVKLEAGYEDSVFETIFVGNVQWAVSQRIGTEWKTEIEAFAGGFGLANGFISKTFSSGYSLRQIYSELALSIPRTTLGTIGNFDMDNSRGITVTGNPWKELRKLVNTSTDFFCDNEQINIINDNEFIDDGSIFVVDSERGLLSTPRRGNARVDVDIIFEPRLKVGHVVELRSIEKYFNGVYKIMGFSHKGIISEAISGTLKTTLNLNKPDRIVPVK